MSKFSKVASVAVLAGLLAGCAGTNGRGLQANAVPVSLETLFGAEDIADGKDALRQGNMSLAIDNFRRAAINPQTAGEANNGLGIAYARLGRTDLAETHFAKAIALAPGDARFSSNLARLYRSDAGERMLAQRRAEAEAKFAKAQALENRRMEMASREQMGPERRGVLVFENTRSRLTRMDGKEVLLTTRPETEAEPAPELALADTAEAAPARVLQLRDLPVQNSRITTLATRPAVAPRASVRVETAGQNYPIRVRLSTRAGN